MSAATNVRDDLLGLMGLESISHAPAGTEARMLRDLNSVRQKIYSTGPDSFWTEEPRADLVRAPTVVTLGVVTANSKAITFAGYESWMNGCTLVIQGDDTQNRLLRSAGSSVSLLKPYTGPSGTNVAATVYHDLLQVGAGVEQVLAPVMLENFWELLPVPHERDRQVFEPGNNHGLGAGAYYPLNFSQRPIQMPRFYLMVRSAVYLGAVEPALRFSTLPDRAGRISYNVKAIPPAVADFDTDTQTELAPHGYHESLLMPMVRYAFSTWPQFTGDKTGLKADYDDALLLLASLRPRGDRQTSVAVGEDW